MPVLLPSHVCPLCRLVVGQRYSAAQYAAGGLLVMGITLFTAGDARGAPNFSPIGVGLITVALVRVATGC
jgi:adenosine 3'-phospho 5'-phosphosulfate transporter B3